MPAIASTMIEICVFRFNGNHPEYLLLKRAPDEQLYPGLWQLVTGTIEDAETAIGAARRELREETGFSPRAFWSVPFVNSFYDPVRDIVNINPFFAAQVNTSDEPLLSAEHTHFEWMPYGLARTRLVWPGQREGLRIVHEYLLTGELAGSLARTALA